VWYGLCTRGVSLYLSRAIKCGPSASSCPGVVIITNLLVMNSNCVWRAASKACRYGWQVSHYRTASHHEKARGTNKKRIKQSFHGSPKLGSVVTHGSIFYFRTSTQLHLHATISAATFISSFADMIIVLHAHARFATTCCSLC